MGENSERFVELNAPMAPRPLTLTFRSCLLLPFSPSPVRRARGRPRLRQQTANHMPVELTAIQLVAAATLTLPLSTIIQRHTAFVRMTTTQTIMMTVMLVFR
jgi:hypothetical protein